MRPPYPKISVCSIVKVIVAPDQSKYVMQKLWGKYGVVLQNVITASSQSLYEVYLEDGSTWTLHYLDLEVVSEENSSLSVC